MKMANIIAKRTRTCAPVSKKSAKQDPVPDTNPGSIIASGPFRIVNHFE
jgi:hypothetical protein